ncbi:hypothetical protein Tco_0716226, partial [Tanacetum coccineum]
NPRQQATIHDERVTVQPLQGRQNSYAADPGIAEGPFTQSVITHNAAYQANDLDAYDSDCDEISTAKSVLMANYLLTDQIFSLRFRKPSHFVEHPENEIHSDSNIIPYSQYLTESQNATVQDINSSAQQDALILSVFEQLSNQVTNYNKVNNDNLIASETLSVELERYKKTGKIARIKTKCGFRYSRKAYN